jgi:nucleotide-binding universal stress UspA family protein
MSHAGIRRRRSGILLPTDFQQAARRAFLHGVKLATVLKVPLHIVHVIKVPVDRSDAASDSRVLRSLRTSALVELGRLVRIAQEDGAFAEALVRYGDPVSCIVEAAKTTVAGMVVMGTEGRIGWDRLQLGSTAAALVREAPCPVLTVHGGLAGDVARHQARVRLRRLLVATDFSRHANAALRLVSRLALNLGASVRLVYVRDLSSDAGRAERSVEAQVRDFRRGGLDVDGRCVGGETVEMILAEAAAWQADLIAVGTRGRRGLHRLTLGSVAEELLRRAGCPVLTVRAPCAGGKRTWP